MSTLREILTRSEAYLAEAGVDSPRLSAQVLVAKALAMDRLHLFLDLDRPLSEAELAAIRPLLRRRHSGEPVAYIVGQREFYGLDFIVAPGVLIPRPETEHLVEIAESLHPASAPFLFADIGVGSGAIAVSLLVRRQSSLGLGLDLNPIPLAVTRANAVRHHVVDRLQLVRSDFASVLAPSALDLIVSNPPYVTQAEYAAVSHEISAFEPVEALVPGPDGLDAYRRIIPAAHAALRPGGALLLEIGCAQADSVTSLMSAHPWSRLEVRPDLAGLDRVVLGVRPG